MGSTVAGRVVEEDMPALVGHGVELAQIPSLGRSDAAGAEVSEPGKILAVDGVRGDAGFHLHRLGNGEAPFAIGDDLRPDLIADRLCAQLRPLRAFYYTVQGCISLLCHKSVSSIS
jgi:hypothetical protein